MGAQAVIVISDHYRLFCHHCDHCDDQDVMGAQALQQGQGY